MVHDSVEDDRGGQRETCGSDKVKRFSYDMYARSRTELSPLQRLDSLQECLSSTTGRSEEFRPRQSVHLHLSGLIIKVMHIQIRYL